MKDKEHIFGMILWLISVSIVIWVCSEWQLGAYTFFIMTMTLIIEHVMTRN